MENKKKANFEYLMEIFDWDFIQQIFNEGQKIEDFFPPNNPVQAIECEYNGWMYNLQRIPMVYWRQLVKR